MKKILPFLQVAWISFTCLSQVVVPQTETLTDPVLQDLLNKNGQCLTSPSSGNLKSAYNNFSDPPSFSGVGQLHNSSADNAWDIITDNEGNFYICGDLSGILNFFGTEITTNSREEGFIAKFDQTGTLIWSKRINGAAAADFSVGDMKIVGNTDIFITGSFNSESVMIGSSQHYRIGKNDLFLARMDKSGNFIWSATWGEPDLITTGSEILCSDSEVYVRTGNSLVKYDFNGNLRWSRSIPLNYSFVLTPTGILISGIFNKSVQLFDGTVLGCNTGEGYDYGTYFLKLDTEGTIAAIKTMDCMGPAYPRTMLLNGSGKIIVGGYFYYGMKLDAGTIVYKNSDEFTYCAILFLLDENLNLQWHLQSQVNGTYINNSVIAGDILIITGTYGSVVRFNELQAEGKGRFLLRVNMDGSVEGLNNLDFYSHDLSVHAGGLIHVGYKKSGYDIGVIKSGLDGSIEWDIKTYGDGGMSDVWYMIDKDADTAVVLQGNYNGSVWFGENDKLYAESDAIYVAKIRSDGSPSWIKSFTGDDVTASGVKTCKDGNIYAWGTFTGDLSGEISTITCETGRGIYLFKFDNSGNVKLMKVFKGTGDAVGIGGIDIDAEKNILLTGVFTGEINFSGTVLSCQGGNYDGFLVKIDPSGNVIWARQQACAGIVWSRALGTDAGNNIYLTGGFNNQSLILDDLVMRPDSFAVNETSYFYGSLTCYTAKYDPYGKPIWIRRAGNGSYYDRGHAITVSETGNAYVAGIMWNYYSKDNQIRFGDHMITGNFSSPYDLFIAKYSNSGQEQWASLLQISEYSWPSYQLGLDEKENVYMAGEFKGKLAIEGSLVTYSSIGSTDLFLVKYSAQGDFQWLKTIEVDQQTGYTNMSGLVVLGEDHVLTGGRLSQCTAKFDDKLVSSSGTSAFIAMAGVFGETGTRQEMNGLISPRIYPNPASELVKVETDRESELIIYSVKGDILFRNIIYPGTNDISLVGICSGTHILMVRSGNSAHYQKLVVH